MGGITVGIFRHQESKRIDRLMSIPQTIFAAGFEHYLEQIKQVTGADVVVFDNTDGVIDTTIPDVPSQQVAESVRVSEARRYLFHEGKSRVAWDVECAGVAYKAIHYPLDRTGRIWTYLLNRTESVKAQRQLIAILSGILMGGILLGALIGHVIAGTVTGPVAQLVEATRQVAAGDLDQRSQVRTQDEIGQLATAFNQMTEQLQASRKALVEAERFSTAGRMSAAFAHEIRNPLSSIRMLIQLLEKHVPTESEKYVQAVLEEVERLNVIVDGMLDFARPTELQFEPTDVPQVTDQVIQFMEANLKHHRIEVQRDYQDCTLIQADPAKLKQVFMNLMLNAMQAMPEGGSLHVSIQSEAQGICIQFQDSGIGMTEEQQQLLFEPFFTTKEHGTGLGLTNALRIVEQHGGTIEIESELGVGTTVSVQLPVTAVHSDTNRTNAEHLCCDGT